VFQHAKKGNTKAIYDLLVKQEASIYDCDSGGWTLLRANFYRRLLHTSELPVTLFQYAGYYCAPNAVRELISWGLNITASTATDVSCQTPLHSCICGSTLEPDLDIAYDIRNILLSYNAYDNGLLYGSQTGLRNMLVAFQSIAAFRAHQPEVLPNYHQLSGRDRLNRVKPWFHGDY
jgi:hypothetical protein